MIAQRVHRFFGVAEPWTGVVAIALLGAASVLTLDAGARTNVPQAAVGGAVCAFLLMGLVTADWIDGLLVIVLAVPLPAVYAAGGARLTVVAPLTAAVVFGLAVNWGLSRERLDLGRLPMRSTVMLVIVVAVAGLFAQDRVVAARELLNFGVLIGAFVVAAETLTRAPSRVGRLATALVAVAAVSGTLALLEAVALLPGAFPRWDTPFNRAALGFGQPNALGLFLAVTLPLAVGKTVGAHSRSGRMLAACATLAVCLGLLATFSRAGWVAVIGGAGAFVFVGRARWSVRIWTVALIGAVVTDVVSGGVLRDTVQRTVGDWVIEQRAVLMFAGILMFLDHPLLGVGPGGFAEQLDRYAVHVPELWDFQATPHNAYVQMAAETGIVGLLGFGMFLAVLLRVAARRARWAARSVGVARSEQSLRLALLWSTATLVLIALAIWPFSHGAGEAVVLILAMTVAGGTPSSVSGERP